MVAMKIKNLTRFAGIIFLLILVSGHAYCKENTQPTKEECLKEIEAIKGKIAVSPDDAELHNAIGYYYFKIGEIDKAEEEYGKAIGYDDKYAIPYNNLGIIFLNKKDYDKAEGYFSDAIELKPNYAKALYNLGVTYFRQKEYIKAVRYYLKAKSADENYVKEREDRKKGEEELKKALKEDPDNEVLQYLVEKAEKENSNTANE